MGMSLNKAVYNTNIYYCFSDKTIQYEPIVANVHNKHILDRLDNFMSDNIYWETGLRFSRWRCEFHPSLLKDTGMEYADYERRQ